MENDAIYEIRKKDYGYSVDIHDNVAIIGNPAFGTNDGHYLYYIDDLTAKFFAEDQLQFLITYDGNVSYLQKIYEGTADIYDYDPTLEDRFSYYKTVKQQYFYTASHSDVMVVESNYGKSVSVWDGMIAVSSTITKIIDKKEFPATIENFYSNISVDPNSTFVTLPKDIGGVVEIYDINSSNTSPSYVFTTKCLPNTVETGSMSFGSSVSINENFVVIGNPYTNLSGGYFRGAVHVFSGSMQNGFTYQTTLTGSGNEILFGSVVKIDKSFNKIVVGNSNILSGSSNVYLYQYSSGSWSESYRFSPTKQVEKMNYVDMYPYSTSFNSVDGFGSSVSIYCDDDYSERIVIGAPYERDIFESINSVHPQKNGSAYIFDKQKCYYDISGSSITQSVYNQTRLGGDSINFPNNMFGFSVAVYDSSIVVASPNFISAHSSSYIQGTFYNNIIDEDSLEGKDYTGLIYVYTSSVSSSYSVAATYKPKKIYGLPYRFVGFSTALSNGNLIVGCPIILTDDNIDVNVEISKYFVNNNLQGNFVMLNLNDYYSKHHVGNVFYKHGKMVFSTSGSIFDTILNTNSRGLPSYDMTFKNQQRLYQKEYVCTINPGEFNYSTNPTSYTYFPYAHYDLNKNGKFDFSDCDKLLRYINKKLYGSEYWWETLNILNSTTSDGIVENSLFNYYTSNYVPSDIQTNIIDDTLYQYLLNNLDSALDANGDGVTDLDDMYLIWKFFADTLTMDNYDNYITTKSVNAGYSTFDKVISFINDMAGKDHKPMILSPFIDASYNNLTYKTNVSSSRLTPYITTVGLYNGADLVAVAKMGTPIKNDGQLPLNIIVRFDY